MFLSFFPAFTVPSFFGTVSDAKVTSSLLIIHIEEMVGKQIIQILKIILKGKTPEI